MNLQLFILSLKIKKARGEKKKKKLDTWGCELGSFISALTRSLGGVFCDQDTRDSHLDVMPMLASLSNHSSSSLLAPGVCVTELDAEEEKRLAVQLLKSSR